MSDISDDVFVHDRALCEADQVGAGTRVWAFSHVQAGAVVGRDCNIGECVFIEGGAELGDRVVVKNGVSIWARVTLEDDVFAGPNAVFTNDLVPRAGEYRTPPAEWRPTLVREGACIGANATIVCGTVIGRHAFVGAGAVVTRDVPDHVVVVGSPARPVGWICVCGNRLNGPGTCDRCGRVFVARAESLAEQTSPAV